MDGHNSWSSIKEKIKAWFTNPNAVKNPTKVFEVVVYSLLLVLGGYTLGAFNYFSSSTATEAEKPTIVENEIPVADNEQQKADKKELKMYQEIIQGIYSTFSSIQAMDDMDYYTKVFEKGDTIRQIVLRDKSVAHKIYCYEVEKNKNDDSYYFTRSFIRDDRTYPMEKILLNAMQDATKGGLLH